MDEEMARAVRVFDDLPVAAVWLFGSRARGDESPASDYDIAALPSWTLEPSDRLKVRLDLIAKLGSALRTDRVDLVWADEVSPLLAHRLLRDGRLLCCRDDVLRVRFEVHALREYFDTRPLDEEYFTHLRKRYAGAGGHG